MTLPAIHRELLTPDGMAAARRALINRFPWFVHVGNLADFESYQERGLRPQNPGMRPPPCFAEAIRGLGADPDNIVCFWPVAAYDARPRRPDGQRFQVALAGESLPALIGLDWSYGTAVEIAQVLRDEFPDAPFDWIFAEAVRRRGSVVSYLPIPAPALRVCAVGCPENDPAAWPRLVDTDRRNVIAFE